MGLIGNALRSIRGGSASSKRWTPAEVREMIAHGKLAEASAAAKMLREDTQDRQVQTLCLQGQIAFHDRRDEDALELFRAAAAEAPGLSEAHYGLSLVLHARKQFETALSHAQFAVNNGTQAVMYSQLGLCHLELGNYVQADNALSRATRLDPSDKYAWNNLGIALQARGDLQRARGAFERAAALDPRFEHAKENARRLASSKRPAEGKSPVKFGKKLVIDELPACEELQQVRDLAEREEVAAAIDACESLLAERPDDAAVAVEMYELYRASGDAQSGLDVLEAFRVRHPGDVQIMGQLGRALVHAQEYKLAKPLVTEALERLPDDVPLLLAMAEIRSEQKRYSDVGALLERAYALQPTIPVKGLLADAWVSACRYTEALALSDEILAEAPEIGAQLVAQRVHALTFLGRHDEALPLLDAAIDAHPNEPARRFPRATIHLLNERFAEGWEDYSFRQLASVAHLRVLPFPLWRGEPLGGKTILVLAEQGLGDQVMFASCLPDLLALGPSRTIVEVVERVAPTVKRSFPTCEVIATNQDNAFAWVTQLGDVDYFVAMGDLPRYFRRERAAFPEHRGYLQASAERIAHWTREMAALGPQPKIGISWRGGTEITRQSVRTMALNDLMPLAQACDATFVCLQYGEVGSDLADATAAGLKAHYWPEAIKDLDEFSALISSLDLVITVCNTTVHYAGALGRPVWVMAPHVPEWRYGLHFDSMPWYPSSRMFRQPHAGDWPAVVQRVSQEMSSWHAARAVPPSDRP
jgi:tetratricopeptide (TPR) repeat protein